MPKQRPLLATTDEILMQLNFIRNKKQEYFVCLSLDSAQRLITRRIVFIGTLTSTLIHPREIFAGPLRDHAATVIIAHNHPSGDCKPSDADITATQQLIAAGILLGVPLKDHVIIAKETYFSFKQHYLI